MSLVFAFNGTPVDFSNLTEELIFVFTAGSSSAFFQSQQAFLDQAKSSLQSAKIFFVSNLQEQTQSPDVIYDPENQLISKAAKINPQNLGNNLLVFRNLNGNLELLEFKENTEKDSDWMNAVATVSQNYSDSEPDDQGCYKWGQRVAETGEYLCKDCGYILELTEGQIFPICEVCLAGEPSGPSEPHEGYWERV